jgi:hypothetical protein
VIGFRVGALFGNAGSLTVNVMKMVSQWLHAGPQKSLALDQAISLLVSAAGESQPPNEEANAAEKKKEEEAKDDKQADGAPEAPVQVNPEQADASPSRSSSKPDDAT